MQLTASMAGLEKPTEMLTWAPTWTDGEPAAVSGPDVEVRMPMTRGTLRAEQERPQRVGPAGRRLKW